jgi:hypothetical protein
MMAACDKCGTQNPEEAAVCEGCGAAMASQAPAAGSVADAEQPFPVYQPPRSSAQPSSVHSRASANAASAQHHPEHGTNSGSHKRSDKAHSGPPDFHHLMIDPDSLPHPHTGIELMPWKDLSTAQKASRLAVAGVGVVLLALAVHGFIGMIGGSSGPAGVKSAADSAAAAMGESERKDGIQSLCKVFQIYGLPKSAGDADAAAKNAAELFKLPGSEPQARSVAILTQIAHEFSDGKLKAADCAAAGEPLPTSAANGGDSDSP